MKKSPFNNESILQNHSYQSYESIDTYIAGSLNPLNSDLMPSCQPEINLSRPLIMRSLFLKLNPYHKKTSHFFKKMWISALGSLMLSSSAYASSDVNVDSIDTALQAIRDIMMGPAAKTIAVIAIAGIGFMWMSGRLSMKQAVCIALGIGIIFGASDIAALLGAGETT